MSQIAISFTLNGEAVDDVVAPRINLVDYIRQRHELTGSHVGCEHGVCGACTVQVDGQIVRGCLMLAAQADGTEVKTVEGLSADGSLAQLQQAFWKHNALQCGFCTPGMLLSALELISLDTRPSRDEIRAYISGNYCRCTGYQAIVDAIEEVAHGTMAAAGDPT